jgi:hypothetical protein
MNLFEIVNREIDVIGKWLRRFVIYARINQSKNHRTTIDVVSGCVRNSTTSISQELAIEVFGPIEV